MKNFWKKLSAFGGKKLILALAPMAGVTDSAFRQICREQGADVVYTEMVSADGLFYDSKKTLALLKFNKKEKPIVIQLFGKNPQTFIKAARICEQAGFDGLDINFGCPARKVVAHGGGVTLMRDLDKCKEIIQAVLSNTKLPVSVKIRAGIEKITAVDFIKKMKKLPLSALMIHGRYFNQPFSGLIDFKMIKKAKQEFQGIVLGNGGINTPEDAKEMIEKTGVDGIGLARGIRGRPWLFWQIRNYLNTPSPDVRRDLPLIKGENTPLEIEERKKIILRHAKLAFQSKNKHGIVELRKHLAWYMAGYPEAKILRNKLVRVENIKQIKEILEHV